MNSGTLFAEAKHVEMLRRMRLIREEDRGEALKRIAISVLIGWFPLAILNFAHSLIQGDGAQAAFLADVATHARLLLAVPLLIAADYIVLPRLETIGRHFGLSTLIPESQRAAFDQLISTSRRLSAGVWPSTTLTISVYALVLLLAVTLPREMLSTMLPHWQLSATRSGLSLAGWWHLLVSLPLLLGLTFAWLWRLGIWIHFLWVMSRMGLCLVASHPDRAGGLQFVAFSPRIFTPVSLAISIVAAGAMANKVLHTGMSPIGHELTPAITAIVMLIIFASPPLLFSRVLLAAWRGGVFLYGDLASRLGQQFEHKWLETKADIDAAALAEPDFSATTDLFSVVSNVYGMRLLLFDYPGIVAIVMSAILPFLPIWLSAIPFQTIVTHIVDLLF